jgi:hypothetical protein
MAHDPDLPAIQYRGLFLNLARLGQAMVLDKGSPRFLSYLKRRSLRLDAFLLFLYTADDRVSVRIARDGHETSARRVYVSGRFPFLHRQKRKDTYKTLFYDVRLGLEGGPDDSRIGFEISRRDARYRILTVHGAVVRAEEPREDTDPILREPDRDAANDRAFALADRALWSAVRSDRSVRTLFEIIRLYCARRVNHREVFKLMKRSGLDRLVKARDPEALSLVADIEASLAPLQVGRHGYRLALKYADLKVLEDEIAAFCRDATARGAEPLLNSGTLLGYVRDGGPIPHDDDLDLAVVLRGDTPQEAAAAWRDFATGIARSYPVTRKGAFFSVHLRCGYEIDVFPAWIDGSRLHVYPYCWGAVAARDVVPMQWRAVHGAELPFPIHPERLLEVNYGPNWKTPDPYWRFDYRTARKQFGGVLPMFLIPAETDPDPAAPPAHAPR